MHAEQARLEAKLDLALRMQFKLFRKVVIIMGALEDLRAVAVDVKSAADRLEAYAADVATRPAGVDEAAVSAVVSDLRGVANSMNAAVPVPAPVAPAPEAPAPEAPAPSA